MYNSKHRILNHYAGSRRHGFCYKRPAFLSLSQQLSGLLNLNQSLSAVYRKFSQADREGDREREKLMPDDEMRGFGGASFSSSMVYSTAHRIKWLGHIQRMDQARPTRKLLDWKPMGTRPVGRPRQRWQEDVNEDLKKLKVKNWKVTAKDRRTWRDLAEKAKPHKGL